jgi:hypothetical protein
MGTPEYFEVRVAGKVRDVCFSTEEADGRAMEIAWAEWVEVEVRPIRKAADRDG